MKCLIESHPHLQQRLRLVLVQIQCHVWHNFHSPFETPKSNWESSWRSRDGGWFGSYGFGGYGGAGDNSGAGASTRVDQFCPASGIIEPNHIMDLMVGMEALHPQMAWL